MRELVLAMAMSLDGFVAGPDGEIDWIFSGDPDALAWKVATVSNASLHLMGGRTFRDMAAHWPMATGPFAAPMNDIPKAVVSRQGTAILPSGAGNWGESDVLTGDLADEIARLKAIDGKPIVAHGGAAFARSLVAANLVDVYALLVYPLALGAGLPIFSGLAGPRRLERVSSTVFPGGCTAQVYRPA